MSEEDKFSKDVILSKDGYQIKVPISPAGLGEEKPASWREVLQQVNGHLKRVVSGTTRFLAEGVESLTRFVRGVGVMPSAIAERIKLGHQVAEIEEARRQRKAIESRTIGLLPETGLPLNAVVYDPQKFKAGLDKTLNVLKEYEKQGYSSKLIFNADGTIEIHLALPQKLIGNPSDASTISPIIGNNGHNLLFPSLGAEEITSTDTLRASDQSSSVAQKDTRKA